MSTTANVTDPVKPTIQGVPFWIFVAAVAALLLGPIVCPLTCNSLASHGFFTPEDALNSKAFYSHCLNTLGTYVAGTAGSVALGGSLMGKAAKYYAQLSPSIPTPVTDAPLPTKEQLADLIARSGFDLRDLNIGAAPATTGATPPE